MVRKFKSVALAGVLMMVAAPAFAQDLNINPLGLPLVPNSVDIDPLHIFTPAAAPAMAPAPMMKKPMMHHKMMMKTKMMMKKPMMKKKMMMKKM